MSKQRKTLTIIFLALFTIGALPAIAGEITGAFVYWFMLLVLFVGIWPMVDGRGPMKNQPQAAKDDHSTPEIQQSKLRGLNSQQERLLKQISRIRPLPMICGALFICLSTFAAASAYNLLFSLLLAIPALRSLCKSRTALRILTRASTDNFLGKVYLPSMASYSWISFATVLAASATLSLVSSLESYKAGENIGKTLAYWLLASAFTLDVPVRLRKQLAKIHSVSLADELRTQSSLSKPPVIRI
jgi:hypothetical protein